MGRVTDEQGRQLYISKSGGTFKTAGAGRRPVTAADNVRAYVSGRSTVYVSEKTYVSTGMEKRGWKEYSQKQLESRRKVIKSEYSKIKEQRQKQRIEERTKKPSQITKPTVAERKKLYEEISAQMAQKRKQTQFVKKTGTIKEPAPKAAPSTRITEKRIKATQKGAAFSTLTPEQEREYGVITKKEYERKIGQRGFKPAAKKFIFGAAEVAEEIRVGREKSLKRTEAFAEIIPPPTAKPKTYLEGAKSFGRAVGRETIAGAFSVVDIPVAGMEAALKGTSAAGSAIFFPETRKSISKESKRSFAETKKELSRPEVIASAGIFAGAAMFSPKIPTKTVPPRAKPRVEPKTKSTFEKIRTDKRTGFRSKPEKSKQKTTPEKQFFTDIKTTRTTDPITGKQKAKLTGVGEQTGKRQTITKSQLREIIKGKKAQARDPFGRIEEIIGERRKARREVKPKDKPKDIVKGDKPKDIIKFEKPRTKTKDIIISSSRKVSRTKTRNKDEITTRPDKDIIKVPEKKPPKIIKDKPSDIIKPPKKDIIKTPERKVPDIIRERPKPKKETRTKEKPLREKAKAKRRGAAWFDLPDLDLGGGGGGGMLGRRAKGVTGRKTGYKASLVAETLGIYGKPPTKGQFTGYEFRPLLEEDKKKKKKRGKIY